jgi:hypothetical protein
MLIENSNELMQQKPKEAFIFDDSDTGYDLTNSTQSS